jgi:hypothetical protein
MLKEKNSDSPLPTIGGYARCAGVCLAACMPLLAGCTPAFDWRSVRVPETRLVSELPCRPGRFQRDIVAAGVPLKLFMLSCEAGGVTYGVATAEVGDPTRVDAVLAALATGAAGAIRAREPHVTPFDLAGATPFKNNVSARIQGMRQDGTHVEESLRVFGRGTRVFQASVIGLALVDAQAKPFEDGLRFDLENHDTDPS